MKLSYFQLEPHIKKKISPLYLLSGEDPFLKQEAKELSYILTSIISKNDSK